MIKIGVQENVEGIATNKNVYAQVQKLMKGDHNIDRTVKQVETKLKKLRSRQIDRVKGTLFLTYNAIYFGDILIRFNKVSCSCQVFLKLF